MTALQIIWVAMTALDVIMGVMFVVCLVKEHLIDPVVRVRRRAARRRQR